MQLQTESPEAVAWALMDLIRGLHGASGAIKDPDEILALYARCLQTVRTGKVPAKAEGAAG